jgi:hypothetical protein
MLRNAQARYPEAEALYKRSLAIMEGTVGPDHPNFAATLENYAATLKSMKRDAESAQVAARARDIRARHSGGSATAQAFRLFGIVLLQPDHVLQPRMPGVEAVAAYTREVEAQLKNMIERDALKTAAGGFIVLALKPGNEINVWLDFNPPLEGKLAQEVVSVVKSVPRFSPRGGVVVYALKVGFWGGKEPPAIYPFPPEWKAAAARHGGRVAPEQLVEMTWK